MEINGLGQQYYGINPSLDKALLDKGYNPNMNLINSSNTTVTQDADENIFSKGAKYIIDFLDQMMFLFKNYKIIFLI